jgi:hypothetical protein
MYRPALFRLGIQWSKEGESSKMQKLSITFKGVAQEIAERYPHLSAEKISKALELAEGPRLWWAGETSEKEPIFEALSSDGVKVYRVSPGACTCPARGLCYHRIARGIVVTLAHNKTEIVFGEAVAKDE